MAYDIGTARGVIEMEYNGRGVTAAEQDLAALEKKGMTTKAAFGKVGLVAGVAGTAIAAGLGVAVNAAANFEQRMSAVEAVSGASADQMDKLSAKALQLGKDTSFSATEGAQAIEELVKAGLSVEDVLNGAADATVNLAAAGEIALPEAATIASNAMNQFNLAAEDMVSVADSIAGAANASAIDVGDFGQSLQQVGAVANLAGVSFEDTATAIALLGNAGIKGSDAGTSLKSMFQRLQPTTEKQANLMKELGLLTEDGANKFYDAAGNMKSLSDVSGVLQNSLKGMSKQQKQAALNTLFGSDAIRAAAILANNGSKGFDKMAKSMGKVSAADVAAKRLDNFKGSMEQLKGSLETLGIQLGTILLPFIRQVVDGLVVMLNWFLSLDKGTQKWIVGILAGVAALLLMVAALISIVGFISSAIAAFSAIGAAMGAISLGPILAIVAVIALVVAGFVLLYKHSERFRDLTHQVWSSVQEAVRAFVDFFVGDVWPELKSIFDLLMQSWDDIQNSTGGAMEQVRAIISTVLNLILSQWTTVWNLISGVVMGIWTAIKGIIMGGLMVIKGIINVIMGVLKGDWGQAWEGIKQILKGAWTAISAIVRGAAQVLKAIIIALWNTVKNFTSAAWNIIKNILIGAWNVIKSAVSSAAGAVKNGIQNAWDAVKTATSDAWTAIKNAVSNGIQNVMSLITSLPGKILGALAGLVGDMYAKGVEIVQALIDGIGSMAGSLADKAKDVIGGGIGKLIPGSPVEEGPLTKLNNGHAGKEIVKMVIDGITDMATPLKDALSGVMAGADPLAYATPGYGVAAKPRGKRGGTPRSGLRMVRGELRLDKSGRAFIEGVASDEVDDDDDYDDTLGRMG
jgi:TP901 family phage tail tape measure protein